MIYLSDLEKLLLIIENNLTHCKCGSKLSVSINPSYKSFYCDCGFLVDLDVELNWIKFGLDEVVYIYMYDKNDYDHYITKDILLTAIINYINQYKGIELSDKLNKLYIKYKLLQ